MFGPPERSTEDSLRRRLGVGFDLGAAAMAEADSDEEKSNGVLESKKDS